MFFRDLNIADPQSFQTAALDKLRCVVSFWIAEDRATAWLPHRLSFSALGKQGANAMPTLALRIPPKFKIRRQKPFVFAPLDLTVTHLKFTDITYLPATLPIHGFHPPDQGPGLSTKRPPIHRQSPTQRARDPRHKFGPCIARLSSDARHLGTGHSCFDTEGSVTDKSVSVEPARCADHRTSDPTIPHQQITPEPQPEDRFRRGQLRHKVTQILSIRRLIKAVGRTTHPPRRMFGHRFPVAEFPAQAGEAGYSIVHRYLSRRMLHRR
jgi:hypothetical protein